MSAQDHKLTGFDIYRLLRSGAMRYPSPGPVEHDTRSDDARERHRARCREAYRRKAERYERMGLTRGGAVRVKGAKQ